MKEITLKIPDTKFKFFMELIQQLGFEANINDTPEEQKSFVRDRIKTAKKEDFVTWEEARKQLKFKKKRLFSQKLTTTK